MGFLSFSTLRYVEHRLFGCERFGLAALCEALQSNPQLTKKQVQAAVGRPTGRLFSLPISRPYGRHLIRLPICLTPNLGPHVGIGLRQSWENYVDPSHTSCPKKPGRGSKSWFCTCRTDHQITVSQNAFCPSVHRQIAGEVQLIVDSIDFDPYSWDRD